MLIKLITEYGVSKTHFCPWMNHRGRMRILGNHTLVLNNPSNPIMKLATILSLSFFFNWGIVASQSIGKVRFKPMIGTRNIKPDTLYKLQDGKSILFNSIKFYVSEFKFLNEGKIVYSEKNSFHLVDVADPKSLEMEIELPAQLSYNKIEFNLGIDSVTNYSGARGGELDPTRGMYWTWQNGYINIKIEGKLNQEHATPKEFQFHLGGYQFPFNALQKVSLECKQEDSIFIGINLAGWISEIPLSSVNQVMSPGKEAVNYSEAFAKTFSIVKN